MLQVHLLGQPIVNWCGDPIHIMRRQTRALLYYLVTDPHPCSRESLCFLFWPDISETAARRHLTRLLTHLKRSLPDKTILNSIDDLIALNQAMVWVDVQILDKAYAQGVYDQVIELYRGPFLGGFSIPNSAEYETWAAHKRSIYEYIYLECLEKLIALHTENGRYRRAITLAQRYLEVDFLAEFIHKRLIELFDILGDRSAAQKQYAECAVILEKELGVEPLPETNAALRAALSNQHYRPDVQSEIRRYAAFDRTRVPTVGRDEILRQIHDAADRAISGKGSFVLLTGEPGIGKSHILQIFGQRYQDQGIIFHASADLSTQSLPYNLITQAFRATLKNCDFQNINPNPRVSDAVRLLPELRTCFPNLPQPLIAGPDETRLRLFDSLCQLLIEICGPDCPIFLCLDDLHWSDRISLEWLIYLGTQMDTYPIFVLGACLETEQDTVLRAWQGLIKNQRLTIHSLSGLKQADLEELLTHLDIPWQKSPDLSVQLMRITAGNPFFFLELLQNMLEAGHSLSDLVNSVDLLLPRTVIQTIETRLARLSPIAKQILEAISVIGSKFNIEFAMRTAGRSELESGTALDELTSHHLLEERDGIYLFHHEIIRVAVYRRISYWRKRLLHRRAAQTLQDLEPGNITNLAWHFERGELYMQAVKYMLIAGRRVKNIFAYQEARHYFDHALELLDREVTDIQTMKGQSEVWHLLIQVLAERGWVFRLLGDMQSYEKDLKRETQLVLQLGDKHAMVHLHWREAVAHRWFCRYSQSLAAAKHGLDLHEQASDPLMEARLQREVGLALREIGEYPRAQHALEISLDLFKHAGDMIMVIHTLGNLSTLYEYQESFDKAMDTALQALKICDDLELNFERRLPLGDMGAIAVGLCQFDQGFNWLSESLQIARQIDDRTQEILCQYHLGGLYLCNNNPHNALEYLQTALKLAQNIDSRSEQSRLHIGLSKATAALGDSQAALQHAQHALDLARNQERRLEIERAHQIIESINSV